MGSNKRRLKTHCKWGHEFVPANVYIKPGGKRRQCVECTKIRAPLKGKLHRIRPRENYQPKQIIVPEALVQAVRRQRLSLQLQGLRPVGDFHAN